MSVRAVVVGASGYSGAEVVSILLGHGGAELAGLFASGRSERAVPLSSLFGRFRGRCDLPVSPTDLAAIIAARPDVVFLATPHEVSHDLAPELLEQGIAVLDLSGAFRLSDSARYPRHYGFEHRRADLLASAAYGLPERNRSAIAAADLVAVPGCYPTSAILPLAPLADGGVIDAGRGPVIIDAVSGVSGAGRAPSLRAHFCEASGNLLPYGVLSHRHEPEIAEHSGADVLFTPHLGPFDRGILSTIHVPLGRGAAEADVRGLLETAYAAEPFIRLLPPGAWPAVADVRSSNFCDIGLGVDAARSHLILVSAIDNLVKGAAGQAVQCFNVRFGLPETAGLIGAAPCLTA